MAYQAPYSGLAQLMELQGRRGDSMLVHMNPMEVRMLEAMSPDGRLSTNPDTGLPEAFKLKDILGVALPIAGGALLGPAVLGLAPGLGALGATAVGTGIGGLGAGLIQGKGFGDALIQGGLSGLMSYGLGSAMGAFAPSGGVTATPAANLDVTAGTGGGGLAGAESVSSVVQQAAPEPTGFFGGLGETLRQTPFTDVPSVGSPTIGSMLGSGASGLLASGLTTEQMPYDVADVGMDYPYYDADLEGGRLRGRAAARQLQSPPSFLTSRGLYERAISPGGRGTFFAADGGQVPKPYGDPYGPSDPYGGMADETDFGQPSGTEQSADVGPGMSLGLDEPVADLGFGAFNPTPMSLGLTALGMVPGPIGMIANVANIGRSLANVMGPSVPGQVTGLGTTTGGPTGIGIGVTGQAVDPNFEAVSEGYGGTGMGGEDSGSGDQGDTGVGHGAGEGTSEEGATDFAQGGGISSLAYGGDPAPVGFANKAFEGMVPGTGTGMSDDVPFSIEGQQPALLSRDEYVLPADVVSQLGDGSSGAGADMLDSFVSNVRQTKYGSTQQPAPVGPQLMTGLMRQGGVV